LLVTVITSTNGCNKNLLYAYISDNDMTMPFLPDRMTVIFNADSDGLFGRQCPNAECKHHFKVNMKDFEDFGKSLMNCVYCGSTGSSVDFLTNNQLEYARSIAARTMLDSIGRHLKQYEINPEPNAFLSIGLKIDYTLPEIRSYIEEDVKRSIKCQECNRSYSVYGVSYFCPFCGKRNAIEVFNENVITILAMLEIEKLIDEERLDDFIQDGFITKIQENALKQSITIFEFYCKKKFVARKMLTSTGLNEEDILKSIGNSFQNIDKAHNLLSSNFDYDIKAVLLPNELIRLKKLFAKRHILTHYDGIIDSKYIWETQEDPSLEGKRLTINAHDVKSLLNYLQRIVMNMETSL
jgi:hypothetical protein